MITLTIGQKLILQNHCAVSILVKILRLTLIDDAVPMQLFHERIPAQASKPQVPD